MSTKKTDGDRSTVNCPTCNKLYGGRRALGRHHSVEHGETLLEYEERTNPDEYQCDHGGCFASYTAEKKLAEHKTRIHNGNDEVAECEYDGCERTFDTTHGMRIHHKLTHGESIATKTVACAWCGDDVTVSTDDADRPRFCDHGCFGRYIEIEKQTATCERCGDEFTEQVGNPNRFCSVKCSTVTTAEANSGPNNVRWKGPKPRVICEWCGETYVVEHHAKDTTRFCSTGCQGEWDSVNQRGENHPRWAGGSIEYGSGWTPRLKKRIRDRDGHECRTCGLGESGHRERFGRVHSVHHIVKARTRPDAPAEKRHHDDLLVTLCTTCHSCWEQIPPALQFLAFLPHPIKPGEQTTLGAF